MEALGEEADIVLKGAQSTFEFALKLVQFGTLGLGFLIIVLIFLLFVFHLLFGKEFSPSTLKMYFAFMGLGVVSMAVGFGTLVLEKLYPPNLNIAVAFSPKFETIGIPVPEIRYGGSVYVQGQAFSVRNDAVIMIQVDDTIDNYRKLQEERLKAIQFANKLAEDVSFSITKATGSLATQQTNIESAASILAEAPPNSPPDIDDTFISIKQANGDALEQLNILERTVRHEMMAIQ